MTLTEALYLKYDTGNMYLLKQNATKADVRAAIDCLVYRFFGSYKNAKPMVSLHVFGGYGRIKKGFHGDGITIFLDNYKYCIDE